MNKFVESEPIECLKGGDMTEEHRGSQDAVQAPVTSSKPPVAEEPAVAADEQDQKWDEWMESVKAFIRNIDIDKL